MRCRSLFGCIVGGALALAPVSLCAHGVLVEAAIIRETQINHRIEVRAAYHSGKPMAGAQAKVFAPGGSESPWLTGVCDDNGGFSFEPPPEMTGEWVVRVAHLGHAGVVTIGLEEAGGTNGTEEPAPAVVRAEASAAAHLSTLQRVVMGACVVWGLIGTALFFSRRRV